MALHRSVTTDKPQLIGGQWCGASGTTFDVVHPATEKTIASIASSTPDDVERALAAARAAQPHLSALPIVERGDRIRAAAGVLREHRDDLAALLVAEVGKPYAQARGEIDFAIGFFQCNSDWDRRLEGEILPGDDCVSPLLRLRRLNPTNA